MDLVNLERHGPVALLTLNRPEALNALSIALIDAITERINEIAEDDDIMVAVITGAGKAFCAGIDLKELTRDSSSLSESNLGDEGSLIAAFNACPKPIIAAVNGVAVTGGLELVLACDFVYASQSASFADTHAIVGIMPAWGCSQILPRLVGINRARELSFTGRFFTAQQACDWGMVNRVCEDDKLIEQALETAAMIAEADPETLYKIKRVIRDGSRLSFGDAIKHEGDVAKVHQAQVDYTKMAERLEVLKRRAARRS